MKMFLVHILVIATISGCASQKAAQEVVDSKALAAIPVVDLMSQHARAVSIVREDKDLKDTQKEKLIDVLDTYAKRSQEIKLKQSQYRIVLVKELLNSGKNKNPRVEAAKKKLTKLDEDSSRDLGKFIRDFKFHAGNMSSSIHPMREMIIFR